MLIVTEGEVSMSVSISDPRGVVSIEPIGDGRNRVSVSLAINAPMPISMCETAYSPQLIECLMRVKGPAYLCQEIVRGESPTGLLRQLSLDVLSYVNAEEFAGRSVLDFACGCGASSMALLKLCPQVQLVGIDLRADCVDFARKLAAFYGFASGGGDILSLVRQ
jgi:hypothetical protein